MIGEGFIYDPILSSIDVDEYCRLPKKQKELNKNTLRTTMSIEAINNDLYGLAAGAREMSDATSYFALGLATIRGSTDTSSSVLRYVSAVAGITFSAFSIMKAIIDVNKIRQTAEVTEAIAETSAYTASQQYARIGAATMAGVAVAGMFGLGFHLGKNHNTTNRAVDINGNIDTPIDKRRVLNTIGSVT